MANSLREALISLKKAESLIAAEEELLEEEIYEFFKSLEEKHDICFSSVQLTRSMHGGIDVSVETFLR